MMRSMLAAAAAPTTPLSTSQESAIRTWCGVSVEDRNLALSELRRLLRASALPGVAALIVLGQALGEGPTKERACQKRPSPRSCRR